MKPKPTLLAVALTGAMLPAAALAEPPPGAVAVCPDGTVAMAPTDVRSELERKFGEKPIVRGLTGEGALMQLYASKRSQTWTLLMTSAEGHSCVIGVGEAFEALDPFKTDVRASAPAERDRPAGLLVGLTGPAAR